MLWVIGNMANRLGWPANRCFFDCNDSSMSGSAHSVRIFWNRTLVFARKKILRSWLIGRRTGRVHTSARFKAKRKNHDDAMSKTTLPLFYLHTGLYVCHVVKNWSTEYIHFSNYTANVRDK